MEKEKYQAPVMEMYEIVTEQQMLASSPPNSDPDPEVPIGGEGTPDVKSEIW